MMWLDRLNVWLLCILLALAPLAANASQNALSSPTTGTVSGLQLTNNYNNALDSLNTGNSGASAPTNQLSGVPSLGNIWLNSTSAPYPWQLYDGANWVTPFWVDSVNHVTNVKIGGGVASVASSSTVDLCASSGNVAPRAYITITGTTTVNSFGSTCNAGHVKIITFAASLTLTYNASSMIIPGGGNVITSAGDQAVVVALGSGNWQVISYTPANGQALINPSIDVGDYVMTALLSPPSSKYLFAYGQAISRSTYATFLSAVTITQSVSATNGSPTLTGFSDTTQLAPGMAVEASFLPNGTVIAPAGCTSTTCTLNNNATSSTTGNVTIFPYGNGCGIGTSCGSPSTTFNMPDCRDVVMAGRGNMGGTARSDSYALTSTYFGATPNAIGVFGGGPSTTLVTTNLPPYTPSGSVSVSGGNSVSGGTQQAANGSGTASLVVSGGTIAPSGSFTGTAQGGTSTPFSRVQPTMTVNCMMRVLTMLTVPSQHFASNDNTPDALAILERRRQTA